LRIAGDASGNPLLAINLLSISIKEKNKKYFKELVENI
jgi:hypothetical protein